MVCSRERFLCPFQLRLRLQQHTFVKVVETELVIWIDGFGRPRDGLQAFPLFLAQLRLQTLHVWSISLLHMDNAQGAHTAPTRAD